MIKLNFSRHILKNGIRYIEVPDRNSGALSFLISIKAGSRFEKEKENGISHFLEHMFFKGGKKYKNSKEISCAIDQVGGIFDAYTEKEIVNFFIQLPSKNTEVAFEVFSDMFLNSIFRKEDIRQEKNVIIEEINMYEDSPMYQTGELLESTLYKGNSLERSIIGKKETVNNLKRKDFISYIKRNYLPENIVIVVSGDTSKVKKDKLSNYFNISSRGKTIKTVKPKEIQEKPEIKIKFKKTEQTHISLGFRFPEASYTHKDFFKARILNIILGEGMSSRLFLEVRDKKGLAYRINSFMESFADTGYINIGTGVDNKKVFNAVEAIIFECQKMKNKIVDKGELNKAREYLKGKIILSLEDPLKIAFNVGRQELLNGKIYKISEMFKRINDVSPEDILKLAKENFNNNKLNLALIGPFKDDGRLKRVLKIS